MADRSGGTCLSERLAYPELVVHGFLMSVQDVLELANELSREDRTVLFTSLGEQLAGDFSPAEVEDINRAVAEADAEFERGEAIPAAEFYKKLGL